MLIALIMLLLAYFLSGLCRYGIEPYVDSLISRILAYRGGRQCITSDRESVQAHVTLMNSTLLIHSPCSQMWQATVCTVFTHDDDCRPCEDMPNTYTT